MRAAAKSWLPGIRKFTIITVALILVFMTKKKKKKKKEDHEEDIIALIAIVKNQQESLLSRVRNLDAQTSLLNAKFDLCETLIKGLEDKGTRQTDQLTTVETQLKSLEEQLRVLKDPASRYRKW